MKTTKKEEVKKVVQQLCDYLFEKKQNLGICPCPITILHITTFCNKIIKKEMFGNEESVAELFRLLLVLTELLNIFRELPREDLKVSEKERFHSMVDTWDQSLNKYLFVVAKDNLSSLKKWLDEHKEDSL